MSKLSDAEKAAMVDTVEDNFNDTCTIRSWTGETENALAERIPSYTDLDNIPCSLSLNTRYETKNERGQIVILEADAFLRVSLDQAIDTRDLVVAREKTFTVDGVIDSRSCRIVALRSFETGEAGGSGS